MNTNLKVITMARSNAPKSLDIAKDDLETICMLMDEAGSKGNQKLVYAVKEVHVTLHPANTEHTLQGELHVYAGSKNLQAVLSFKDNKDVPPMMVRLGYTDCEQPLKVANG